jgi:HEAT repeat protein
MADPDALVRVYAAEDVWNLHHDANAVARLAHVLAEKSSPRQARSRAAYALGRIGPAIGDVALAVLRRAAADQSEWDVHVAAGRALDAISPPPPAPEPSGPPGAPRTVVIQTLPPR